MNDVQAAKDALRQIILTAYGQAVSEGALPPGACTAEVEPPRDPTRGDWASNFALANAKAIGIAPRDMAEAVARCADLRDSYFSSLEVGGYGFLNARLSDRWYAAVLRNITARGDEYGIANTRAGKKVMVEFVSANPTGPMTTGNARGGVLGDSLASILGAVGYDVGREFYLNDAGHQVDLFGKSLEARYLQALGQEAAFPEDGYHGAYIKDFALAFIEREGEGEGDRLLGIPAEGRRQELVDFALPQNVARMQSDLERYRIHYDTWYAESSLHNSGYIKETIDYLTQKDATYDKDGALWFRATDYGGDKDEVLVKSNGFYTYYAVDIAYHRDKFIERAFDIVIDVWGADHHGHVLRMKAAMAALGIDPERLRVVLMQMVRFVRDGEAVKMSKRTGQAITLADLLDEISVDAARFFFNQRQADSHLEFDLGLAVRQDPNNPVYYVQYAHARIASLMEKLREEGFPVPDAQEAQLDLLQKPEERALIKCLAAYPEELRLAAQHLDPSRVNRYVIELAGAFHRFYNAHRIKGAEKQLAEARLLMASCVRQVLRNALSLLGVSTPDHM
ncbi:MAG: arginine--tRNA ligase [Oscillospiraceae bacterium]|nr:arginine--tRNA ligase [Oscillospiraceae bacterium]